MSQCDLYKTSRVNVDGVNDCQNKTSITSAHCELFYNNTIVKHPSEGFFKIKQGSRPSDYTSAKEFAFKSAKNYHHVWVHPNVPNLHNWTQ